MIFSRWRSLYPLRSSSSCKSALSFKTSIHAVGLPSALPAMLVLLESILLPQPPTLAGTLRPTRRWDRQAAGHRAWSSPGEPVTELHQDQQLLRSQRANRSPAVPFREPVSAPHREPTEFQSRLFAVRRYTP